MYGFLGLKQILRKGSLRAVECDMIKNLSVSFKNLRRLTTAKFRLILKGYPSKQRFNQSP